MDNPYHAVLLKHRIWCEAGSQHSTCYEYAAKVLNINGRETCLCEEHADRIAFVSKSLCIDNQYGYHSEQKVASCMSQRGTK
jgi:hypothetical protein